MIFTANTQGFDSMVLGLDMLLLVMLLGSGIYGLYSAIRLRRTFLLFPNKFLYPGDCPPENCIDEGGFIDFIVPRLTILSIALLLMGVVYGVWFLFFQHIQHWVIDVASMVLPVSAFVWYVIVQRKAAKLFW